MQQTRATIPVCHVCGRTFARTEHLRRHERTHTKEKPYRCPCGRSFSRRDLLTRHNRLSHDGQLPTQQSSTSSVQISPSSGLPMISSHYTTDQTPSSASIDVVDTQSSLQPETSRLDLGSSCIENMHNLSEFLNTVGFDLDLDFEPWDPQISSQGGDAETDMGSLPTDIDTSPTMADTSTSATYLSPESLAHSNNAQDQWLFSHDTDSEESPAREGRISTSVTPQPSDQSTDGYQRIKTFTQPWKITEHQRMDFQGHLEPYSSALEGFIVPSRVTMSRYIAGYVEGFAHHHPIIHIPTFSITNYNESPELVMAIMAIGAQYRYEHLGGVALYRASRAIIFHRRELYQRDHQTGHRNINASSPEASQGSSPIPHPFGAETLGTLLLLAKFASWQRDERLVEEAIEYQYLLAKHARECGLSETEADDGDDWRVWARTEAHRRIKLSVFCFLNLQSLTFQTPPVLMSTEVHLRLPTSCKEWTAADPESWKSQKAKALPLVDFQEALVQLLQTSHRPSVKVTSPFGNYILIHAILQRITITRQLSVQQDGDICPPLEGTAHFRIILDRWKDAWHRAPESILDLKNPKDSLSWSAMSLLGLAHIRTLFDIERRHQLRPPGEPRKVAAEAYRCCSPGRGPHLTQALLHAAHVLNIPVQLGVSYLSKCQAYMWSIQHCICYFECTVFLSKWLWTLSDCNPSDLDASERQLIGWIWAIVFEAQVSIQAAGNTLLLSSHPEWQGENTCDALRCLAIGAVEIHAQMFSQSNSVWPLMRIIGQSLEEYTALLKAGLE
ncbi:hypothetical protein NM208_g4791 [Fusarium decemcellulare]|uniref:Uncharacterized protein n=1 Tax=Fusarium decemcellulare TaxID=57161 RepID=A0ACC1SJD4_9HYPO|nr:hypothetical protein NM208_g4791 [Fusarium decemcellulare]